MEETRSFISAEKSAGETAVEGAPPLASLELAPDVPGYELGELIGRGGMGDVWRARDLELDREVAVKALQTRYAVDSSAAARFVDEARITAQLQHPGIPAVYRVAALADGRPFLAMKLIKGKSLDDLLRSQATLNPLALIEAIAQTLGYAHAHNVIHRDIKPANVMVGSFGEVQVMDWGLAKVMTPRTSKSAVAGADLEATTAPTVIRPSDDGGSHTQHGSVLGTPAYMPPEQAGGETDRVGTASDVFGLGALWCRLLTGEPPFAGSDAESVRRNAMRGKTAEALARLDRCSAEPEVVALVKECLAFEPTDRPVDGNAVARKVAALREAAEERAKQAELSWVRAEVQAAEQVKRRKVLQLAGGLITLALLAGLAASLWQMTRAIAAEQAARKNEAAASEQRDLKAKALDAERLAHAAEARARQQTFAALRTMTDDVIERRFAAGDGHTLSDEDKAFLRNVIAQFDAFAVIQGDDVDNRFVRAEGRRLVAVMQHRLGELQDAEQNYSEALALHKQLAADFPNRPEFRQQLARSEHNRGVLLYTLARHEQAEAALTEALSIQKQLAASNPAHKDNLSHLANSLNSLGGLLFATGRLKEAEAAYGEAAALREQLLADLPTHPEIRRALAGSHNNLGLLMGEAGREQEAEQHYTAALELQTQLAADFPSHPEYRQSLADTRHNFGLLLKSAGRMEEAHREHLSALAIRRQLAAEFPIRPEYRQELAKILNNYGIFLQDFPNREQEAVAAYTEGEALLKQLVADFPTRPEFRQLLAMLHSNRGSQLRVLGRLPEAEAATLDALTLNEQLPAELKSSPDVQRQIADCRLNLALVQQAAGQLEDAEQTLAAALVAYRQLADKLPGDPKLRQALANAHNNMGSLLKLQGKLDDAATSHKEALTLQKQLAAAFPNQPDLLNDIAGVCVNLALLQSDLAVARQFLSEGLPHHLAALKANPDNPIYRRYYHNHLSALTRVHAGLLDREEAVRTAQRRRDLDWDAAADAYAAAAFLSQCVPIIAQHEKLSRAQRNESANFYGDRVLTYLREAIANGFHEVERLKSDPHFDRMRKHPEFIKLIAELEAAAKSRASKQGSE